MADEKKNTGVDGKATFTLAPGIYKYTAGGLAGYEDVDGHFEVVDENVQIPVTLRATHNCTFDVYLDGTPATKIEGAVIYIDGREYVTDVGGAAVAKLTPGTYPYQVSHADYQQVEDSVTITDTDVTETVGLELALLTWLLDEGAMAGDITTVKASYAIEGVGFQMAIPEMWYEIIPLESDIYMRRVRFRVNYHAAYKAKIQGQYGDVYWQHQFSGDPNDWVEIVLPAPFKIERFQRRRFVLEGWLGDHLEHVKTILATKLRDAMDSDWQWEGYYDGIDGEWDFAPLFNVGYTTEP